jgi:hypothetical protein
MKYLPAIVLFAASFCPFTPIGLTVTGLILGYMCFATAAQTNSTPLVLTSTNNFYGGED